jgi:eukaryotic-like serine/threonine-protein kinase
VATGESLGPYRLLELAGEGGMGLVYKAARETDGQIVALKVLKSGLSADETYRRRFEHELRAASRVRHPNLVALLDSGEADGQQFLVYEWVPGRSLDERVRAEGPLPLEDAVTVVEQLGGGLDELHDAGIVHRDVKASNVLLGGDGEAKLTDLGLARGPRYTALTRPGQVLGTLEYLAPELVRGEPATRDSDVYALGCLAYELTTGRTPFAGLGLFQLGAAHLDEAPRDPRELRPDCPPALGRALLLALAKDPRLRPGSGSAYARALRSGLGSG